MAHIFSLRDRMKQLIKNIVVGTRLEPVARRVYAAGDTKGRIASVDRRYNEQTITVMQRTLRRNSNCVDVGCHKGSVLKEILRLAPRGTHYAFEPIPELYQKLVNTYPIVRTYGLALSDRAGESSFQYVVSNPAYSGLIRRRYDRPNESVEEITVKTDVLDNIIPKDLPIRFVKIDVEGAELQVLRGAVETIRRTRPIIVFEHGLGGADCYGTVPEDVYDLLTKECGLCVSLMEKWLGNRTPLSRQGFIDQFYQLINFVFIAYE